MAWQMATGSDLAMPGAQGRRTLSMRITNAYTERVLTAAESDPLVCERFLRATQLIDPPARLLHPAVMLRAVTARRQPRRDDRLMDAERPKALT